MGNKETIVSNTDCVPVSEWETFLKKVIVQANCIYRISEKDSFPLK